MYVIVDGSYTRDTSDIITCGVIMVDELGFYEEKQFRKKHMEASSSFAEWFGIEKALEELSKVISCTPINGELVIYTDYIGIVNAINDNDQKNIRRIMIQNKLLSDYIHFIKLLRKKVESEHEYIHQTPLNIEFRHLKSGLYDRHIMRLHQKAHNIAQINKQNYNLKNYAYSKEISVGV